MPYGYSFHWHEPLEILYVIKGSMIMSVEQQTREVRERDIVVVNSGVIHGFYDTTADIVMSIFQFDPDFFDQTLVDIRDPAYQSLVFSRKIYISSAEDGELHSRFEELILAVRREYYCQEAGFRLAIKEKLYRLALIFLRELPVKPVSSIEMAKRYYYRQILDRIFSYTHRNYNFPDITLERAAEVASLSKFYFTHFFKEQTGQTFHIYLSKLRIRHAQEFLIQSDMTITDIAYLSGFASIKTFNRLFKTYVGVSPSSYRSGVKVSPEHPVSQA